MGVLWPHSSKLRQCTTCTILSPQRQRKSQEGGESGCRQAYTWKESRHCYRRRQGYGCCLCPRARTRGYSLALRSRSEEATDLARELGGVGLEGSVTEEA